MSTKSTPTPSQEHPPSPWWRTQRAYKALGVFLTICAASSLIWWEFFHPYICTDDARVAAVCVGVAPPGNGGAITHLNVDVGSRVRAGQLLVELDRRAAIAQLIKARARAKLTASDLRRARRQVSRDCSPRVELDNARCAARIARADLRLARVALDNTRLCSTVDGIVAQKFAERGDMLGPGQTALVVVDIDRAWIAANIEETYAGRLRIDQPVKIAIDEGGEIEGRVSEILNTTAAQFALIPSDNGSGNYTKIVQRIPIKVALTAQPARSLRVGQSVEIAIFAGK